MTFQVQQITKDEWAVFSQDAHKVIFRELREPTVDRIDFALLGTRGSELVGYATVRELDDDSIYLQYGGAFDNIAGTVGVFRVYNAFLEHLKRIYKRVSTLVSADNVAYLKLAMKCGLRIIGARCYKGEVFVELFLEFENA